MCMLCFVLIGCPFEPFMCLDIETLACTCNYTLLFISAEIVWLQRLYDFDVSES